MLLSLTFYQILSLPAEGVHLTSILACFPYSTRLLHLILPVSINAAIPSNPCIESKIRITRDTLTRNKKTGGRHMDDLAVFYDSLQKTAKMNELQRHSALIELDDFLRRVPTWGADRERAVVEYEQELSTNTEKESSSTS